MVAEGTADAGMGVCHSDFDGVDLPDRRRVGDFEAVAEEDVVESFGSGVWGTVFNYNTLAVEQSFLHLLTPAPGIQGAVASRSVLFNIESCIGYLLSSCPLRWMVR